MTKTTKKKQWHKGKNFLQKFRKQQKSKPAVYKFDLKRREK